MTRRLSIFATALLGLGSSLAAAAWAADSGITLAWQAVQGQPGSEQVAPFDCQSADATYRLYATFVPYADLPDFAGLEATVDLGYFTPPNGTSPPLSPFWHFEQGGCNGTGLTFDYRTGGGTGLPSPWSSVGYQQILYAPDSPADGRGRLQISLYRSTPMALTAGTEYFAFTLDLSTCLAGVCPGCDEEVGIYFAQAALNGESQSQLLTGPNALACVNACVAYSPLAGAQPAAVPKSAFRPVSNAGSVCLVTPVAHTTWGQLKVVYR